MHPCPGRPVLRRNVYYFHGFDPASTARYRRIFVAASERLAVQTEDLPGGGDGWRAQREGVVTDFHYLRYEDQVRTYQDYGPPARFGRGLRALVGYGADGALSRLHARTLALMLSPYLVGFGLLALIVRLYPLGIVGIAAAALSALGAWFVLFRLKVILAADLFAYMRELATGRTAAADAYEARLPQLEARIRTDSAETLIAGHSLGGIAAIRTTAELLDKTGPDARVGLLTLGSVHGILLAQRGAGRDKLARCIARICADPRVFWVDVTSPRDPFCVPLTDPLCLIGPIVAQGMTSPKVISAQLARAPQIPGDRRTVFAAMRRHMGYLLAPPEGSGFDYADIVTGHADLRTRFADRGNSPRARMWQA